MKAKWLKRLERSRDEGREVRLQMETAEDPYVHGFVLGLSDELVLLFKFLDFHPDGCVVVRTKDITKVQSGEPQRQSERMLEAEGLTKAIGISEMPPLDGMKPLLEYAQEARLPVIVEADGIFVGYITRVEGKRCWIHNFDVRGQWDEKPTRIKVKGIDLVHFEGPYAAFWLRHIEACPSLPDGDGQ